jgi:hypothetical protein
MPGMWEESGAAGEGNGMSEKASKLVALKMDEPDQQTVELLTDLLEQAQRGEVVSIIAVAVHRECGMTTTLSSNLQIRDACYGLRLMGLRIDRMIMVNQGD